MASPAGGPDAQPAAEDVAEGFARLRVVRSDAAVPSVEGGADPTATERRGAFAPFADDEA
jgi:hypothetical protein